MFARNVCFSRSEWQDPRLMYPFPGAIGRFRIHGARILPTRPPFRVERPEITHSAKNLPALPGLSRRRSAGREPANWPNGLCALRPGPCPLAACASLRHLACASRALRPRRHLRRLPHCAPLCPRPPPALPVARAATCARHPRPAPQTSGTVPPTQCGHKNRIPERGSH